MGCDIHTYIEYKSKDSDRWRDFGSRINPGRNYWMFAFMAGVRASFEPVVPQRGIPDNLGSCSSDDYWNFITEDGGDGYTSVAQAERSLGYGERLLHPDKPLLHNRISCSDWHSASWLTAQEFAPAIVKYLEASGYQLGSLKLEDRQSLSELATQTADPGAWRDLAEYWAILAAMNCFEAQGYETRLVFWFDN